MVSFNSIAFKVFFSFKNGKNFTIFFDHWKLLFLFYLLTNDYALKVNLIQFIVLCKLLFRIPEIDMNQLEMIGLHLIHTHNLDVYKNYQGLNSCL